MSEPPVPLVFEADRDGRIAAVPGPGCRAEPSRCRALVTTDFGTEFSLWDPDKMFRSSGKLARVDAPRGRSWPPRPAAVRWSGGALFVVLCEPAVAAQPSETPLQRWPSGLNCRGGEPCHGVPRHPVPPDPPGSADVRYPDGAVPGPASRTAFWFPSAWPRPWEGSCSRSDATGPCAGGASRRVRSSAWASLAAPRWSCCSAGGC